MSQYIVKMDGFEILNTATINVDVVDIKSSATISHKEFTGSTIKELLPEVWNYVRMLKKKYPGIQVDSTGLPKQSNLNTLTKLVSLADVLDQKGFYDEAREIDQILFRLQGT